MQTMTMPNDEMTTTTMKVVSTAALLLAIYGCSTNIILTAAFNADVRPVASPRPSVMASTCATASSHHRYRRHHDVAGLSNLFETQSCIDDVGSHANRHGIYASDTANDISRRSALVRFAAASATFLGALPSMAEDAPPTTAFSESPTSDASIARLGYEGKIAAPAVEKSPVISSPPVETEAPAATTVSPPADPPIPPPSEPVVSAKEANVAKSTSLEPKVALPLTGDLSPDFAIATAAFVGLAVIANNIQEDSDLGATATAPPVLPYGLSGGRNNPVDDKDVNDVKQVESVTATPLPPSQPEKKKWQAEKPIPYGILNPNGKNPFLKEILDYCEGGKVTERCTETIKDYLDNLADSGAVASSNEVKAIVGYLDSLGSNTSGAGEKKKVGAAFTSYLDALSAGSAPPPSSAQAVKTYLDTLNGTLAARKLVTSPIIPSFAQQPPPAASTSLPPVAANTITPDFAQYDNRLTSIEGRVSSLEMKVDKLPDQVFEKIEAWQTKYEARMSEEVKKIVRAMQGPPVEPVVVASTPPALEAAVREVPIASTVAQSEPTTNSGASSGGQGWTSAIVDYPSPSPLSAIPERPGVPRAGANSSSVPNKYGRSGGQGWKTGIPKSGGGGYLDNMNVGESSSPSSATTPESLPSFPKRRADVPPTSSSPGPKKYGISGGKQGWKTGKPMKGGGYLDNMSP